MRGDRVWDMAGDAVGNTYVTGDFAGTAIFGTVQLTAAGGNRDAFVAKLDPSGNVIWAQRMGADNVPDRGFSAAVDATGNTYVLGTF